MTTTTKTLVRYAVTLTQTKAAVRLEKVKEFLTENGLTDNCFPGLGEVIIKGLIFKTAYQEVYCHFSGTTEKINMAIAALTGKFKDFKRTNAEK